MLITETTRAARLWSEIFFPLDAQKFAQHYPEGKVSIIRLEDIPSMVLDELHDLNTRFVLTGEEHLHLHFERLFTVSHTDHTGGVTYGVTKLRRFHRENSLEELTTIVDIADSGQVSGLAEMRLSLTNKSPFFKNKPFEEYTESRTTRCGLGIRRARVLNAVSRSLYGLPLYSSTQFAGALNPEGAPSQHMWRKMVDMGLAVHFREAGMDRYVFA